MDRNIIYDRIYLHWKDSSVNIMSLLLSDKCLSGKTKHKELKNLWKEVYTWEQLLRFLFPAWHWRLKGISALFTKPQILTSPWNNSVKVDFKHLKLAGCCAVWIRAKQILYKELNSMLHVVSLATHEIFQQTRVFTSSATVIAGKNRFFFSCLPSW